MALPRLERDAVRHCPARRRPVALEPEVVVQPPRVVALDDEDRPLHVPLTAREGLRSALRIPLSPVFGELLAHLVAARFGLPQGWLHPDPTSFSTQRGVGSGPVFTGPEP